MTDKVLERRDIKKVMETISVRDFQNFGLHQIAYIRQTIENGKTKFVIHAADGEVIHIVPTKQKALGTIIQSDLEPITLH